MARPCAVTTMASRYSRNCASAGMTGTSFYMRFDLLELDGKDLRREPIVEPIKGLYDQAVADNFPRWT
jgi:ATP-dependent DNA ligase